MDGDALITASKTVFNLVLIFVFLEVVVRTFAHGQRKLLENQSAAMVRKYRRLGTVGRAGYIAWHGTLTTKLMLAVSCSLLVAQAGVLAYWIERVGELIVALVRTQT